MPHEHERRQPEASKGTLNGLGADNSRIPAGMAGPHQHSHAGSTLAQEGALTIRNAICGVLLAAPTVAILAIIGWSGLGVVILALALLAFWEHVARGVLHERGWLAGLRNDMVRRRNPSHSRGAGNGGPGVGVRG